jgi:hypothetical protein
MAMQLSKHLNERQLRGLEKMGTTLIPGDGVLPPFGVSECSRHVDRVLDYMPAPDLADLKMLLGLMSFLPMPAIWLFMRFLEASVNLPFAGVLRFARIGIRGLVMTLYYCDPGVLKVLEYQVDVYTADLDSGAHDSGARKNTSQARDTSSPSQ